MKNKINYGMVSLLQFLLAVFVILFHCSRIFESDTIHFIQRTMLGRMAVPFFVVCSAFFIQMKTESDLNYLKHYIKHSLKTYFIWSIVFLPYGLSFFRSLALPSTLLPLALLIAVFYTGMYYHLWYVPAFLTGYFLVYYAKEKVRFKYILSFSCLLYLMGSVETYSAYLKNTFILPAYLNYAALFYTTRNGLFFMPIFICAGYALYRYKDHPFLAESAFLKLFLTFLFLCVEGWIIFQNQGIDKNFLLMLVPFTFFLFNWAIRTNLLRNRSFSLLKDLSVLYFFLHPIFIDFSRQLTSGSFAHLQATKGFEVIFTLVATHLVAIAILKLKKLKVFESFQKETA